MDRTFYVYILASKSAVLETSLCVNHNSPNVALLLTRQVATAASRPSADDLCKSIITGLLTPSYGVAIFTSDWSECDLLLPAYFLEFAS